MGLLRFFKRKKKKYLIIWATGGLCNKINAFVEGQTIAEMLGRKLLLYWDTSWKNQGIAKKKFLACNCEFKKLFENPIPEVSKKFICDQKDKKRYLKHLNGINIDFNRNGIHKKQKKDQDIKELKANDPEKFIVLEGASYKSKKYLKKLPHGLDYYTRPYWKALKPTEEIRKKVEEFYKKYFEGKYIIGVHIRKGPDHISEIRMKISTDEKYCKRMTEILKENPKAKFFLATNCYKTEKAFKNKFKNKIITIKKKWSEIPCKLEDNRNREIVLEACKGSWKGTNREDPKAIQEALMGVLLLSKTDYLIKGTSSTFSKSAIKIKDAYFYKNRTDPFISTFETINKETGIR